MEAMAEELRADPRKPNIKFTSIYPYMVDTGLCKKPFTRFPSLMKMVKPDDAAAAIIDAQRRGLVEASIPKYILYLNTFMRIFPLKTGQELGNFLDTGLKSDLWKVVEVLLVCLVNKKSFFLTRTFNGTFRE